jgi:hypothetical protein
MAEETKENAPGVNVDIVVPTGEGKKTYRIKLPVIPTAGEKMDIGEQTLTIEKITYKDDGNDFIPVLHLKK